MALIKDPKYLALSTKSAFDQLYQAGHPTPNTGIYRCEGCGHEIASTLLTPLPSRAHHYHVNRESEVLWKLIVFAEHIR